MKLFVMLLGRRHAGSAFVSRLGDHQNNHVHFQLQEMDEHLDQFDFQNWFPMLIRVIA